MSKHCKQLTADAAGHEQRTGRDQSGLPAALLVVVCVALVLCACTALAAMRLAQRVPGVPEVHGDDLVVPDAGVPADDAPRERLMSLGFALLFVSLGMCLYTMYRLGFCCYRREFIRSSGLRRGRGAPSCDDGSRLHLISVTDLPPTYEAITQPPPYFALVTFQNEKAPANSLPAPAAVRETRKAHPGGVAYAGVEASSRPQEAG